MSLCLCVFVSLCLCASTPPSRFLFFSPSVRFYSIFDSPASQRPSSTVAITHRGHAPPDGSWEWALWEGQQAVVLPLPDIPPGKLLILTVDALDTNRLSQDSYLLGRGELDVTALESVAYARRRNIKVPLEDDESGDTAGYVQLFVSSGRLDSASVMESPAALTAHGLLPEVAATLIQAAWRMWPRRREFLCKQFAVTMLAAAHRGRSARQEVFGCHVAATVIQEAYLAHLRRRDDHLRVFSASLIQGALRGRMARRSFAQHRAAAITIQSAARRHAAEQYLRRARSSASRIAAARRGYVKKGWYRLQLRSAVHLQRSWRGHACRCVSPPCLFLSLKFLLL